MKRQLLLLAAMLLFARSGFAQQTNGMLFCAFNGGVDIHATSEPWSPIIGRIRCGERVMVFEDRFALKHIRTEDGLEGFITDITIGQWAILWDSPQGPLLKSVPALPSGAAFPPTSASDFRRFEIAGLASYLRTNDTNFAGGEASFAAHLNDWFAIVAAADAHADVDLTDFRYTTYRAGVRWTPLRQTVTGFAETTAGGSHVRTPIGPSANGFSFTAGGGFDLNFSDWIAWRMAKVDYMLIRIGGDNNNGIRLGTGVVFRFGHK